MRWISCARWLTVVGLTLPSGFLWSGTTPNRFADHHRHVADPTQTLTLCLDGEPQVEIVIPRNSSPVIRFAARELKQILDQSFSSPVEIVHARTRDINAIFLGDSPWARVWGVDVHSLARDAFVIRAGTPELPPGVILIAGRDDSSVDPEEALMGGVWAQLYERATVFGVYDFVEKFLGVRFFFPGEATTVIPRHTNLSIPIVDRFERPDFPIRNISAWYVGTWVPEATDPAEQRRLQNLHLLRMRAQTEYVPNNHGLARMAYIDRFGESNPEFFSLLPSGRRDNDPGLQHPGALCYSNPGFREVLFRDAQAFLSGFSAEYRDVRHARYGGRAMWSAAGFQPGYFNAMPQDGLGANRWCRCPDCWPYWTENRSGELVWGYTVDLAERLKQAGIPGFVTQMAYTPFRNPPPFPIPDNIRVQLAVSGPWNENISEAREHDESLVHAWNRHLGTSRVWLWNYMTNHGGSVHPGTPPVSVRALAAYYQRLAPHIDGVFLQTEHDWALFQHLNLYTFMKLAWDTSIDVEALLQDHHERMFGPAAEPMGRFFDQIEELWMTRAKPESRFTEMGPTPVRRTEREIWDEIYTESVLDALALNFDEAKVLAAVTPDSLARVHWFREQFLGEMLRQRNAYVALRREIEDLVVPVRALPPAQAPTIDGILDEPFWVETQPVFLVPLDPEQAPHVRTTVRARWSPTHLYLAFDCEEPEIDALLLAERARDDPRLWQDSSVEIFLNPDGNRRNYVQIIINADGVIADVAVRTENNVRTWDWDWNADIATATRIEADRYTVEVSIPLADLTDFLPKPDTTWVANFARSRNLRGQSASDNHVSWSPFLRRGFHEPNRFGRIRFVTEDAPADDNLLRNGDFSVLSAPGRPDGWSLSTPGDPPIGTVQVTNDDYRSGGQSLRIEMEHPGRLMAAQTLPDLVPGQPYLLTAFVRGNDLARHPDYAGRHCGAYLNIWAGRNFFFPQNWTRGSFGWSKMAFTFTAPEEPIARPPYLRLALMNTTGSAHFDDVRLRTMP